MRTPPAVHTGKNDSAGKPGRFNGSKAIERDGGTKPHKAPASDAPNGYGKRTDTVKATGYQAYGAAQPGRGLESRLKIRV